MMRRGNFKATQGCSRVSDSPHFSSVPLPPSGNLLETLFNNDLHDSQGLPGFSDIGNFGLCFLRAATRQKWAASRWRGVHRGGAVAFGRGLVGGAIWTGGKWRRRHFVARRFDARTHDSTRTCGGLEVRAARAGRLRPVGASRRGPFSGVDRRRHRGSRRVSGGSFV